MMDERTSSNVVCDLTRAITTCESQRAQEKNFDARRRDQSALVGGRIVIGTCAHI
jgi:hypothetical protein